MGDKWIFDLLNSVASIGSMLVSIIVFLTTIRRTEKERIITQEKENLRKFSSKIHFFLKRLIDPEKLYDNFAIIYGSENFPFEEKHAEIMKLNSAIDYAFQEICFFSPDNDVMTDELLMCIQQLSDKVTDINKKLCDDIKCRLHKTDFQHGNSIINFELKEYYQNYEECIIVIFKKLHILKQLIGKSHSKIINGRKKCVQK